MGNKTTASAQQLYSDLNKWTLTRTTSVYQRINDRCLAQLKVIDEEQSNQIQIYDFRHKNNAYLVDIVGIITNDAHNLCSQPSIQNVFIQYMPYRLVDLGALGYEDSIYILYQCFRGLEVLREKYGLFAIDEELIGFNHLGNCKVWVNANYQLNRNQNSKLNLEIQAIQELFSLIEPRMNLMGSEKNQYEHIKAKFKLHNFKEVLAFLNELRSLNKVKNDYRIQLPSFHEFLPTSSRKSQKLSLKKEWRKNTFRKTLNHQETSSGTPNKKNFLSSLTTQRQSQCRLGSFGHKSHHKTSSKCLQLKKNILNAKNIHINTFI